MWAVRALSTTAPVKDQPVSRWTAPHVIEAAYAVVLLAALTQGPVLSLWLRAAQQGQPAPDTAVVATYLALQMPAVALLVRRGLPISVDRRLLAALGAFVGWTLLSTVWSTVRIQTMTTSITLATTTVAGVYLARFSCRRLATLTFVAMQPGLLLSEFALRRHWVGAVSPPDPSWNGAYFNRNSLGPPAIVGVFAGTLLIAHAVRTRHRGWAATAAVATLFVLFDLRMQHGARSVTSWIALAVAVGTWALWAAVRVWRGRRRVRPTLTALGRLHLLLLAVGCGVIAISATRVSRVFDRPPGFDSRDLYWRADWRGVRIHPLRGWGWLAAWSTPRFRLGLPGPISTDYWSHNAYLDLALGGGVVAVVLFAAVIVLGFGASARVAGSSEPLALWPLCIASAVAVAATQESFFVGSHFYWLLLVGAFTHAESSLRPELPGSADGRASRATRPTRGDHDEAGAQHPR